MPPPQELVPLDPRLQVSFYYRLRKINSVLLSPALAATVKRMRIPDIDADLGRLVPASALKQVAALGLRGEVVFPVPGVLRENPRLLGYYRLLFGFSQKEFYYKGPYGRYRGMEERGEIATRIAGQIEWLSESLIATASVLVEKLDKLSIASIHELQLLTIGPQWRGEENTRIGQQATVDVFNLVRSAVKPFIISETRRTIDLRNAAGRTVVVEFGADPDVTVVETLDEGVRPILSIEIKGGADASNVHNRLGEAEKSHQKARGTGYLECWTILRVAVSPDVVRAESPTTTRAYGLDQILHVGSPEHRSFLRELASRLGV